MQGPRPVVHGRTLTKIQYVANLEFPFFCNKKPFPGPGIPKSCHIAFRHKTVGLPSLGGLLRIVNAGCQREHIPPDRNVMVPKLHTVLGCISHKS